MAIAIRRKGSVAVLDVGGSLKPAAGESELSQRLAEVLGDGICNVILNFTELDFLDSIALGETARCATRTRAGKGELKLVLKPGGKPEQVIRIASMDQAIEIFHDEGEAIASFIK